MLLKDLADEFQVPKENLVLDTDSAEIGKFLNVRVFDKDPTKSSHGSRVES